MAQQKLVPGRSTPKNWMPTSYRLVQDFSHQQYFDNLINLKGQLSKPSETLILNTFCNRIPFCFHTASSGFWIPFVKFWGCTGSSLFCAARKDAMTFRGATPLHWAVGNGHIEVVRVLLAAGAQKDRARKDAEPSGFFQ